MGPTRVNRKLSFESGEEQIKGYGKVTQNTEIFSTKYGNNILEVGSPAIVYCNLHRLISAAIGRWETSDQAELPFLPGRKKLCTSAVEYIP